MALNRSRSRPPEEAKGTNVDNNNEHEEEEEEEEEVGDGTPIRYAPLSDLYSATSPCGSHDTTPPSPPLVHVYSRRRPSKTRDSSSSFGPELVPVKEEPMELEEDERETDKEKHNNKKNMKKKNKKNEKLLVPVKREFDGEAPELRPRLREAARVHQNQSPKKKSGNVTWKKRKRVEDEDSEMADPNAKRWVRLSCDDVDPKKFIGLEIQVYWPLDDDWYAGHVVEFNAETGRHHVLYEDGDKENMILSNERIKFHISSCEMQRLNLKYSTTTVTDGCDFSEMVVLAASFDDDHDLGPGDIIWAKLTGHAVWPAVIVDESALVNRKGLSKNSEGKSISVQFFGTHDFARVNMKHVISFLRGLLSSFHLKCKKPNFIQSLEEAKTYLSEQHLPERMLRMQNGEEADNCDTSSQDDEDNADYNEDCTGDEGLDRKLGGLKNCPFEIGDLRVICIGNLVKDSDFFQDEKFIWPVGYTAVRKFPSISDPSVHASYKMEVLRDADYRIRPLFRVTMDDKEQGSVELMWSTSYDSEFKGSTPSACWNKIYKRMRKRPIDSDGLTDRGGFASNQRIFDSGSDMFGFSHPEVMKLIKELLNSKRFLKSSSPKLTSQNSQEFPVGYRPVHVKWKDLDKCSVCHMDEEYENNVFLQCDKCRMMVHAKCYGEPEPVGGVLWLCNLCRPGAPEYSPPCCLCPVRGGAMKPTTDGRWAHLSCAIWIPETCLSDIKKMEPIDGLSRINKDRWKLLCSICGVSYGACIQCSNHACRVAYHPLCARAAGFCVELADEHKLHLISMDEDEEEQCIQLISFCKKHRPQSKERLKAENRILPISRQDFDDVPPSNPSGCARTEPFNCLRRRGRKEPEALSAASLKRLYVEDRPYLVRGYCRHEMSVNALSGDAAAGSKFSFSCQKLKTQTLDVPNSILSMVEKFRYMRNSFKKRLAFGKSGIHGFGIFAKRPHRAGDMVIEYTGELVRPPIADRREHLIYNSLVGAGTYMFRIDNERVIDATRAGSIAHLINHSCEPNCYSRVISVNGDEHIIIFAKRDIKQWEELTYDYRFLSIDEQLPCFCGHVRCRGIVNDTEAEELMAKLLVPCSELTEWKGE